jgi:hypothetical protein
MEFNSCSNLVDKDSYYEISKLYDDLLKSGKDPFTEMLGLQTMLQKELNTKLPLHNPDPTKLETLGEKLYWLRRNKDSIDDEFRELVTSLGGMSKGEKDASAVWKPWKSKHDELQNMKFSDHIDSDKLEILFEMVDIWHFVLSMFIGLDMTAKDVFILYFLKNKENLNRYENNY